eukprot:5487233-Prymnesium_polylepis.1
MSGPAAGGRRVCVGAGRPGCRVAGAESAQFERRGCRAWRGPHGKDGEGGARAELSGGLQDLARGGEADAREQHSVGDRAAEVGHGEGEEVRQQREQPRRRQVGPLLGEHLGKP